TCRRGDQPAPKPRIVGRTPIAHRIALAHHIEDLIERGELRDYAEAAERLGLTRARLTQICDLALLAPDIQAAVLLGQVEPRDRQLREVGRHPLWTDERRVFSQLFPNATKETDHDRDRDPDRGQPDR
ncbi:MAG: hypothetical protein ACE5FA_10540, partial [Dehalococcoidia bacterium]